MDDGIDVFCKGWTRGGEIWYAGYVCCMLISDPRPSEKDNIVLDVVKSADVPFTLPNTVI